MGWTEICWSGIEKVFILSCSGGIVGPPLSGESCILLYLLYGVGRLPQQRAYTHHSRDP